MKLTPEQIHTFDEQGYVFFPNCFSEDEVAVLRSEADAILRTNRQEVWREKTGAPRTAFAAHTYNEAFRLMAHHPEGFIVSVRGKGGAGRAGLLAPDLLAIGPENSVGFAAQNCHLVFGEAVREKHVALLVEGMDLLGCELHGVLPGTLVSSCVLSLE